VGSVCDVTGWWTACPVTAALAAYGRLGHRIGGFCEAVWFLAWS